LSLAAVAARVGQSHRHTSSGPGSLRVGVLDKQRWIDALLGMAWASS